MKFVVEQDDREKRAIPFPKFFRVNGKLAEVVVEVARLKTADYRSKGAPKAGGVEVKRSPGELFDYYVGGKLGRGIGQLDRLADEYQFPVLLLEMTPLDVLTFDYAGYLRRNNSTMEAPLRAGELVMQRVSELSMERGIPVVWCARTTGPGREHILAEYVINLLAAAEMSARKMKKIGKKISRQKGASVGILNEKGVENVEQHASDPVAKD